MVKFLMFAAIFFSLQTFAAQKSELASGVATAQKNQCSVNRVESIITSCAASPLNVVKRINQTGTWTQSCTPNVRQSSGNSWSACPQPAFCVGEQIKQTLKIDELKRQNAKAECSPRKFTPPAGPDCSLKMDPAQADRIVLHHSAGSQADTAAKIQAFHKKKGWSDVGYHFLIAKDDNGKWKIFEGRPLDIQGAHIGSGLNEKSLGVMIAGNYVGGGNGKKARRSGLSPRKTLSGPPAPAVMLLNDLIANLKDRFKALKRVVGHGEEKVRLGGCHKNCPGPGCKHLVNSLNEKYFSGAGATPSKSRTTRKAGA